MAIAPSCPKLRPVEAIFVPDRTHGRLLVLRDTEDGFVIAEEDLRTRGGGDVLRERQSGMQVGRLMDPRDDPEEFDRLTAIAHRDAQVLLERDPALTSERGKAALMLLALFGHDPTLARLDAG